MPVTELNQQQETIYQRAQYAKGGIGRWHWDKRDQTALNLVRPTDQTIVDIGCGEGITLEKIHRLFPERKVVGIDTLPENVDICNRHGCRAVQGDVNNLPFLSKSVDFVLLWKSSNIWCTLKKLFKKFAGFWFLAEGWCSYFPTTGFSR